MLQSLSRTEAWSSLTRTGQLAERQEVDAPLRDALECMATLREDLRDLVRYSANPMIMREAYAELGRVIKQTVDARRSYPENIAICWAAVRLALFGIDKMIAILIDQKPSLWKAEHDFLCRKTTEALGKSNGLCKSNLMYVQGILQRRLAI